MRSDEREAAERKLADFLPEMDAFAGKLLGSVGIKGLAVAGSARQLGDLSAAAKTVLAQSQLGAETASVSRVFGQAVGGLAGALDSSAAWLRSRDFGPALSDLDVQPDEAKADGLHREHDHHL